MPDLSGLLQRLHTQQVDFVLVGGFAAIVHGSTMVTRDLDVCCRLDEQNLRRIHEAVADLHPVHRMRSDLPFSLTPDLFVNLKNLYLKTDLGPLDCLSEIKGVGNFDEVARHCVTLELPFGDCRVLDLDTLIRAKMAMNREQDQMAVRQLRAIKDGKS